jgi:hypothetical protein
MTDELKKRMARLREIAPRLNSATDQASRLVAMVERTLVDELHIGISAESAEFDSWPAGKDEDGNARVVRQTLAFGRVGTAYRIHVVDEIGIVDDDGDWQESISRLQTPWPSCGRETKLKAIDKLPELLDKIISETERVAATADETTSRIGEMLGDTRGSVGAPEVARRIMICPWCGEPGKWLNVRSHHWGVCTDCEVKWPIGVNLLPSWQTESEEEWQRNTALLARLEEAE